MIKTANAVVFAADIELFPDFAVSCDDVAVIMAVPEAAGVNTPALLMLPAVDGVTDQLTAEL